MEDATSPRPTPPEPAVAPVKDPVCGMTVTPGKAKGGSAEHDGQTQWFCNPRCREKFIADPETHLANARKRATAAVAAAAAAAEGAAASVSSAGSATAVPHAPADAAPHAHAALHAHAAPHASPSSTATATAAAPIYTCPMHPEVRQAGPGDCPDCGMALEPDQPALRTEYICPMHPEVVQAQPGDCPICGMALEPRTATVDEANPELRDLTRRLTIATALTAPAVAMLLSAATKPAAAAIAYDPNGGFLDN